MSELNELTGESIPPKDEAKQLHQWYTQAKAAKAVMGYPEAPSTLAKKKKLPQPGQSLPKGVTPITHEKWDSMEGKAKWDSIVALRGPDLKSSEVLKWFTSSVIRYKMSGVMRVGGMVNQYLPFVVLPGSNSDFGNGQFSSSHFAGHVYEAAHWLGIPIVSVGNSIWSKMIAGKTGKYYILAMIWKESQDPLVKETTAGIIWHNYQVTPDHLLEKEASLAEGGALEG